MRSVDIFKCWPFSSEDVTKEDVESWLPPMVLSKPTSCNADFDSSRSDRESEEKKSEGEISGSISRGKEEDNNNNELVKSEERLEMVCPVCRVFNAATLTAVNAHIDGCLSQTMRRDQERRQIKFKSKLKAPKKRSIAEIFEKKQEEEEEEEGEKSQAKKIESSVLKLWPLDEVSMMAVKKFKWWSRRIEEMRSNEKLSSAAEGDDASGAAADVAEGEEKVEMVCPVCREFNAATVTAVNAHIDSCLAQAMRDERRQMMKVNNNSGGGSSSSNSFKGKPKPLKKRSIAEILTLAPKIKGKEAKTSVVLREVGRDDDDDDDEENRRKHRCDYGGGDYTSGVGVISTVKSKKSMSKRKKKRMRKVKKKGVEGSYRVESVVDNDGKKKKMVMKKKKMKKKKGEFIAKKVCDLCMS